jgi:YcxB-like protein
MTESLEIPFQGQVDLGMLRRVNRTTLAPSRGFKIAGVILALLFFWAFVIVPVSHGEPFTNALPGIAIALALIGFFVYSVFVSGPRKVLESHKLLQDPFSGRITDSGVHLETPHSQADLPWDVFFRAKIGKDLVLLYQSIQLFNVFPREFFASDADWQAFLEVVRRHVSLKEPGRAKILWKLVLWMIILMAVALLWAIWDVRG